MKRSSKSAACVLLAAGMVMSTATPLLPQVQTGLVAFAGENDFNWSTYSKKDSSWWKGSEAAALADEMIAYQLSDGGWRKDMKTATTGSWNKSTIDNNATWGQIRFLANVYNATGTAKYKTACLKGLDLLINGQYSNGGWPQVFNDAGTYHAHITYNDTAIVAVLNVLQEVSKKSGAFAWVDSSYQSKAENAVNKGIQCILNTQIKINGTLTAWGQQHDEYTLAPAGARAYELPSVCTSESVGIVDFLRSLPKEKQTAEVIRSINAAVKWFDSVKIENTSWNWNSDKTDKVLNYSSGSTIWARFYDLQNSKPMFADRDGKAYTDVTQISLERRTGYAWYGNWCANNIKLGTLPEPEVTTPQPTQGTHLYVGYPSQSKNYSTIQAAVDAAAALNPTSEQTRVNIHIAPGTYREQVRVNTPYISFINDNPSQEVKITWYYGIGYKYYSMGSDGYYNASNAKSKSSKGEATRWGSAVALHTKASYFRAEYITFENSFNRYVTDEEIADGVEVSGSESITFQRYKGADVKSKTATERGAAIAVEGDYSEFYKCTFLGSQDTLFTRGAHEYYRDCRIEGNTDYIFGQGTCIFQNCDLVWAGYTDKAVGGYITAAKSDGKYLFSECNISGTSGMKVGSGNFGRPWGAEADVAFVNTKLASESMITSAGWASMSGNAPENAKFKEYNTTVNGAAVNTSGRVSGTVKYSASGLDVGTYLSGWAPYYYNYSGTPITVDPISGTLVKDLTVADTAHAASWSIYSGFGSGSKIFGDRDFTAVNVPASVAGAEAIRTACDSKTVTSDLGTFTAGSDITVYTAVDSRIVSSLPSWLSDWTKTDEVITTSNDLTMVLYKKDFASGAKITLGTNGGSTGCVNYFVLVSEKKVEPLNGSLIQNLIVNDKQNAANWSIVSGFGNGSTIFGDRDFTVQGVPDYLNNAEVVKTACESKLYTSDLAEFTAAKDITVYTAVDTRVSANLSWLSSWTAVGTSLTVSNGVELALYKKDVKSGTKVTLGSNGGEKMAVNYIVLAVPYQASTPVYPQFTNIEYDEQNHRVRLTWAPVEGATKYCVAAYYTGKWRILNSDISASTPSYTSPKNLTPGASYKVAVAAKINGVWTADESLKHYAVVTIR
ncbi:pectate lyase, PelA/Pel-15E family [Ruminococcus sp. YE71]|uniref:pectate lyase n=1 Tax=unclassified Ruminococcus TaxID=2608920 RepID=UPI000885F1DE|nr:MULTISPECIES: pectate lyase [unclassified Ruminococcus]SDA26480.1 pectate lyase, PelA/Pel-15E family [Ruminococcus sp. YE78]SFW44111.1 pectate lyase, PelA/Pel-15E family [Ruminococcus sp. YE71]